MYMIYIYIYYTKCISHKKGDILMIRSGPGRHLPGAADRCPEAGREGGPLGGSRREILGEIPWEIGKSLGNPWDFWLGRDFGR